jgi:RimJ/RimL family protein N-acetyltransferase
MYPILADTALYHFTGGRPPESMEAVQRWFADLESRESPDATQQWLTWIVQLKEQNTPIGYVQATITGCQADIAWLIGIGWQGRGYAKEAVALLTARLKQHAVKQLTAYIHPGHKASQRVATSIVLLRTEASQEGEEIWTTSFDAAKTT